MNTPRTKVEKQLIEETEKLSKLANYFGWVHVKTDNMRKSPKDVWMFYGNGTKLLRGQMGDKLPPHGLRDVSFDHFNPWENLQDAMTIVSIMRKRGWLFSMVDIHGERSRNPLVEIKFFKTHTESSSFGTMTSIPRLITETAINASCCLGYKSC